MKKMMKYFVRMAVSVLVIACCAVQAQALDNSFYATTSKLASGKWVKIAVIESGIYQITADDIRSWGLGSDLSQIHVFGYGGAPLSEVMSGDNYADDLPQMPVVRSADRILFYAQGPITWSHYSKNFDFMQVQHPYANSGCYLVTNDSRFSDIDIELAHNEPVGNEIRARTRFVNMRLTIRVTILVLLAVALISGGAEGAYRHFTSRAYRQKRRLNRMKRQSKKNGRMLR